MNIENSVFLNDRSNVIFVVLHFFAHVDLLVGIVEIINENQAKKPSIIVLNS